MIHGTYMEGDHSKWYVVRIVVSTIAVFDKVMNSTSPIAKSSLNSRPKEWVH